MKKVIYLFLFVAVICIGYSLFYFNHYHIEDESKAIQSGLKQWSNRGSGSIEPDVKEIVQLDETSSYIVLFQTQNGNVGYAHFIKGWNGKFKIDHSGHGTNIVSYEKIKTTKGLYGILVGKNPDLIIDHIKVEFNHEDFNFTVNVSTDEMFVRFKHLPNDIGKDFPAELTYFDKNDSLIELSELLK